jgi:NAD(P)-dependent dehydrogenase (short-subunit alcohol dehydrogenase family)
VDAAGDYFGALDAAFNNAGFAGDDLSPLHELDQALFDRTMAVNVSGTWNCLRSQIPVMLEAGKGAIVNTSSTAAMGATGAPVPYVAAKHAVLGMTRAAAAEYAAHGIRINTLVVGTTRTDMINQAVEAYPELETAFVARQMQRRI